MQAAPAIAKTFDQYFIAASGSNICTLGKNVHSSVLLAFLLARDSFYFPVDNARIHAVGDFCLSRTYLLCCRKGLTRQGRAANVQP